LLARRFRASFGATLRVAQPRAEERARLNRRAVMPTLGRNPEERSDEGSSMQASAEETIRANGASCGELAAVDDARAA
jgi:hypothetical protein